MLAECQQERAENDDNAHLDESGPVLKVGALARAPDVDDGDDSDHQDGGDGLLDGRDRKNAGKIFAEGTRECGDGAAGDHEEEAPAVEKGRETAEAIAN